MTTAGILQRGSRVEASPASEHLTATWGDDQRGPVCDGFRVDGQWEHQRIHSERS